MSVFNFLRIKTLVFVGTLFFLGGCSVMMALNGAPTPDVKSLGVGSSRSEIESTLKGAVRTEVRDSKVFEVYEFTAGKDKDTSRALGHAVGDILSLGVWEIFGTAGELMTGQKFEVFVAYDKQNVADAFYIKPKADIATPIKKKIP